MSPASIAERVREDLKGRLKRIGWLRSAVYLGRALPPTLLQTRTGVATESVAAYEQSRDPWNYATAAGERHLAAAEGLIALAGHDRRLRTAVDVACGEGWLAARACTHSERVLAVDVSPVALERASARLEATDGAEVRRWDLFEDQPLGRFDLVLATGILEMFRNPVLIRKARRRILGMVDAGGYMLVITTKQGEVTENAWWATPLARGAHGIDRFVLASGEVEKVAEEETSTHLHTLYRRSG
jgi:2-polyprenyl-3-methyl-5-hydroxy-6-metoxy-1,4-benzoquinol methylase